MVTDPTGRKSVENSSCIHWFILDQPDGVWSLATCKKCNLIFSEYIGVDFEDSYSHVVDKTYVEQMEFKTKTFKLFFKKIR